MDNEHMEIVYKRTMKELNYVDALVYHEVAKGNPVVMAAYNNSSFLLRHFITQLFVGSVTQ